MREIRKSGSEGGGTGTTGPPYPYLARTPRRSISSPGMPSSETWVGPSLRSRASAGAAFSAKGTAPSGRTGVGGAWNPALKHRPLEGFCQRPTRPLTGSVRFRRPARECTTSCSAGLRARSFFVRVREIRTNHPSGSRWVGTGEGSAYPWHCCRAPRKSSVPGRVQV
jgi:hypothetical protein